MKLPRPAHLTSSPHPRPVGARGLCLSPVVIPSPVQRFIVSTILAVLVLLPPLLGAMSIEQRREHLDWMLENLPEVPVWKEWQNQTGALPPDFDALPRANFLPDRFFDGRSVSKSADWPERRTEIRQAFERYVLGTFPPKPKLDNIVLLDETRGEGYVTRTVRLELAESEPHSNNPTR